MLRHAHKWLMIFLAAALLIPSAMVGAAPDEAFAVQVEIVGFSPDPAWTGEMVEATLKVSAVDPLNGVPSGVVQLRSGGDVQCQALLDGAGMAACRVHLNQAGLLPFIGVYLGQAPFLPGTSPEKELWTRDPWLTQTIYEQDFEASVGAEWSHPTLDLTPSGQGFLGEFGNEQVTLDLSEFAAHLGAIEKISLSFDLYLLRSWDGNQVNNQEPPLWRPSVIQSPNEIVGPDYWSIESGSKLNFSTTFTNWDILGYHQAFPMEAPGSPAAARSGAAANNSLGYYYAGAPMDAVYHLVFTFDPSFTMIKTGQQPVNGAWRVVFSGSNLQSLADESWGLDNLMARVVLVEATHSLLPVVMR